MTTRQKYALAGLCRHCGAKPLSEKSLCVDCLQKKRERRKQLYANGMCGRCLSKPKMNERSVCETCLPFNKKYSKQYNDSKHGRLVRSAYGRTEKHKAAQKIVNDRAYLQSSSTLEGRADLLWKSAKQRAKNKKIPFTITKEMICERLLVTDRCEITGDLFDYTPRIDVRQNPYAASLDQKIPSNGYTPENIQIVSFWYNRFKGDLLDEEALSILKRIGGR